MIRFRELQQLFTSMRVLCYIEMIVMCVPHENEQLHLNVLRYKNGEENPGGGAVGLAVANDTVFWGDSTTGSIMSVPVGGTGGAAAATLVNRCYVVHTMFTYRIQT